MPLSVSLPSVITIIGMTLICHSTYSCLRHREDFLTGEGGGIIISAYSDPMGGGGGGGGDVENSAPPMGIVIEVFSGFALCLLGRLSSVGPFLEVRATAAMKKELVAPLHRTRDFDIYVTRGKVLAMAGAAKKKIEEAKSQ